MIKTKQKSKIIHPDRKNKLKPFYLKRELDKNFYNPF